MAYMAKTKSEPELTEAEITERMERSLRRALTTPYQPQKEMVGKNPRPSPKSKPVKKREKKS